MYFFTCAVTLGSHSTHPPHSRKQEDQLSAAATFAHGLAHATSHVMVRHCLYWCPSPPSRCLTQVGRLGMATPPQSW
uniref:Secreted protein n=1 Tax=Romanomermis culicivorax TaxID=13658 RepID=A0A915J303_ROMCU